MSKNPLSASFARSRLPVRGSFTASSVNSQSCPESLASKGNDENPPADQQPTDNSKDILSHSLALTDLIFGLYAIELWHYNEASGKLFNVSLGSRDEETGRGGGGLFLKRKTQETDPDNAYASPEAVEAFDKLVDRSRSDYLPANPTDPGVGLPGVLWAESSSSPAHHNVGGVRNALRGLGSSERHMNIGHQDSILWRDVVELANDPDQPYEERLQSFAKAGFKLSTGIPFDINGYRGIVIYFGNPHADSEKLQNPANSRFMNNTAQLIGAAAAIQGPMEEVKAFREEISYGNWHRLKIKLLTVVRFGGSLRNAAAAQVGMADRPKPTKRSSIAKLKDASARFQENAQEALTEAKDSAKTKVSRWTKKVQGGSAGIPPSFNYRQCLWTFIGVMTTHTILSRINLLVMTESDGDLSLILAPLGALTTLQYNLTAAPASQPRNAIFAQIFALTVSILLSYIPNVEPWFRSALAPAIVIPGMARLGIIHPPAGAAAIVFSSGKVRWEHFGIFLSGVAISIITAVVINNLSDKRQYPTSWYLINKAKKAFVKD